MLLQKPRCYAEVYNDLDGDIVNFFAVLRDPVTRENLIEQCHFTPFARAEFELAFEMCDDIVERARRTAIRAAMGFGSAGSTKGTTGFRIDTTRSYSTAQHIWARYPETLRVIGERFNGVLVENRPAVDILGQHDSADTLIYADPPYVHHTRALGADTGRYYQHEMSNEQHAELLTALNGLNGMVIVSGYPTELYNDLLNGWQTSTTQARISSNRGTNSRTEQLWMNPHAYQRLQESGLGLVA